MNTSLTGQGDILSAYAEFLQSIRQDSKRHAYTALFDSRLFPAFFSIYDSDALPDNPNEGEAAHARAILSTSGLMAMHTILAEQYVKDKTFPSILIAEDFIIYGRYLARYLFQLEQTLAMDIERIMARELTDGERSQMHYQLVSAIDIHVFARSRCPILLDDAYLSKLRYNYQLYRVELGEVMSLLTPIAYYNGRTTIQMSCTSPKKLPPLPKMHEDCDTWKCVSWTWNWMWNQRQIISYMRSFSDNKGTFLISTVRFYPRDGNLLISQPIFGDLYMGSPGKGGFGDVCRELAGILERESDCYAPLCRILRENNPYTESMKVRLASALLSIADLNEFCAAYELPDAFQDCASFNLSMSFGKDTQNAFCQLIRSPELFGRLGEIIRAGIRDFGGRLNFSGTAERDEGIMRVLKIQSEMERQHCFDALYADTKSRIGGVPCNHEQDVLRRNIDLLRVLGDNDISQENWWGAVAETAFIDGDTLDIRRAAKYVNDRLNHVLYDIRMKSDAVAYRYFDAPYLYRANTTDPGIIPLQDFLQIEPKLPVSAYGRAATYLSMVDIGSLVPEMMYDTASKSVRQVCKVGEIALFYLPRRLSLFLPALGLVEEWYSQVSNSVQNAVCRFVQEGLSYTGDCRSVLAEILDLKYFAREYAEIMARSGQLFRGYGFPELTQQENEKRVGIQRELTEQARQFIDKC